MQALTLKLDQTTRIWLFSCGTSTPSPVAVAKDGSRVLYRFLPVSRTWAEDIRGLIVTQRRVILAAKSEPDEQESLSNSQQWQRGIKRSCSLWQEHKAAEHAGRKSLPQTLQRFLSLS